MKNSKLLVLASLILLGGLGWLLFSKSDVEPAAGNDTDVATEESTTTDAPNSSEPNSLTEPETKDSDQRSEAPRGAEPETGETMLVRGRVKLPFGGPSDPDLQVYALTEQHEHDQFVEPFIEGAAYAEDDVISKSSVASDGSFELRVPVAPTVSWLHVQGRHFFSLESVRFEPGLQDEIELEPIMGSRILGQLKLESEEVGEVSLADIPVQMDLAVETINLRTDNRQTLSPRVKTDAEGRFEIFAVPTDYGWTFEVLPRELAPTRITVKDLKPGEVREVTVELGAGGAVHGRVVSPSGDPVADARVRALLIGAAFGFDDDEVRTAETDSDGKFELTNMPLGDIALKADHDHFLESKRVTVTVHENEISQGVELELAEGRRVTGIVHWPDGNPAVNIEVKVEFDRAYMAGLSAFNALRGASGNTRTGDDGRFEFRGLGQGPFVVGAIAPPPGEEGPSEEEIDSGEIDRDGWWFVRAESVQPDSDLELTLHEPPTLHGRVLDSEGNPLSKFTVLAIRRAEGAFGEMGMEGRTESFEAEDGSFLIAPVVDGTWEVTARAEGFVSPEPYSITVPSDEEMELRVVAASTVSGRVLTPAGTPVADAEVSIDTGKAIWTTAMVTVEDRPTTTSDSSGYFQLESLPPGSIALEAAHDDYCTSLPVAFELIAGTHIEDAEIKLREGGRLTGLAYDKQGEPAVGFMIVLNSNEMEQMFGRTDAQGEFSVEDIPPGSWQVIAMNSGADLSAEDDGSYGGVMNSMTVSQADIVEGETTHVILGAPPEDPVKVIGKVTHDGEPYLGANLIFFQTGSKLYENMKFATFEKDGRYTVTLDGPGEYVVYLQKMGRTQMQQQNVEFFIDVPLVAEHTEDFEVPLGKITGKVMKSDGTPAVNARVTIATDGGFRSDVLMGGQYSEVQTDAQGAYTLEGLRPGTYMVAAGGATLIDATGDSNSEVGRVVRNGVRLSENEWKRNFDFQLEAPGDLEVTVIGLDGQQLSEAGIFLRDSQGRPVEPFSLARTEPTGRCLVRGLAPGDYTVMARKGLAVSAESPPVRVVTGKKAKLELRLEEGTVLWIKLKDSEGEDVRASISVRDTDSGKDWASFFGMDDLQVLYMEGAFSPTEHRLGPLPPGKYRIEARSETGSKSKPVTLRGEPERKITLRLKP